ncbi:MAG: hypothetical protein MZV63_44185 [Marinilabiliales bacterium]|nr:hypothetical protein [Marinilabiliales bacterium]
MTASDTAVTVMMVAGGYPDSYRKGFPDNGNRQGQGEYRLSCRHQAY